MACPSHTGSKGQSKKWSPGPLAPGPEEVGGAGQGGCWARNRQQPEDRRKGQLSIKAALVVAVVTAGCWGGLACLPWPSPKPVTPRHLETITGNNEESRRPGCFGGSGPVSLGEQRNARPTGTSRPLPPSRHTQLPAGPAVRPLAFSLQMWGLEARECAQRSGQKSGDPALSARVLAHHCGSPTWGGLAAYWGAY